MSGISSMNQSLAHADEIPFGKRLFMPHGVVATLLGVEILLFCSWWFQWFSFNAHKGWTVIIAVAAMLLTLVFLGLWFLLGLAFPRRIRFQYNLRTLLLLFVAVAIPCSWLGDAMRRADRQHAALLACISGPSPIGGCFGDNFFYDWPGCSRKQGVAYDYECGEIISRDYPGDHYFNRYFVWNPPNPPVKSLPCQDWLYKIFGVDFFADVVGIWKMNDSNASSLQYLPHLRYLGIHVSDAANINYLKYLPSLECLYIYDSTYGTITDVDFKPLQYLTNVKLLRIDARNITSRCLEYIKHLPLECLSVVADYNEDRKYSTGLSGAKQLASLKHLKELRLYSRTTDDKTLESIKSLKQLKCLVIYISQAITDQGLVNLQGLSELQYLEMNVCCGLTGDGLKHLNNLHHLRILDLHNNYLTNNAVKIVSEFSQLEILRLPWPNGRISKEGLAHLKKMKNLEELDLYGFTNGPWDITDPEEFLGASLPNCKIISSSCDDVMDGEELKEFVE
jgi:hypothetical protein